LSWLYLLALQSAQLAGIAASVLLMPNISFKADGYAAA
jgi:hypothetical protein